MRIFAMWKEKLMSSDASTNTYWLIPSVCEKARDVYLCREVCDERKRRVKMREHPNKWANKRKYLYSWMNNIKEVTSNTPVALLISRHRTLKVMKPHNWICILPVILLMENLPFSFSLISFRGWQYHCDYHLKNSTYTLISCSLT